MAEEELINAFTAGRISRRSFVRQLVDRGMPMPSALAYADALSPQVSAATATATDERPAAGPAGLSETPSQVRGLEVSFVGDGYVVYQPVRERLHSLNHTAALVLELCTGGHTLAEIARKLQTAYQLGEPPEDEVRRCIAHLYEEGLIE